MPWRKYKPKKGKYGLIYNISKNISVRKDLRGKWTLFIEKKGYRKSVTFGSGRVSLRKAIETSEYIAKELASNEPKLVLKVDQKTESPRFREISKQWLEEFRNDWDPDTFNRYSTIRRLYLSDSLFFNKAIDEVSRREVRALLKGLKKKLSARTIETVHAVISGIFENAIEDELIQGNPSKGVLKRILPEKRKRNVKDPEPFTLIERNRFENWAAKHCNWGELMLLKVMNHAGLRLGEALAFRLGNLDTEKMIYHVTQSFRQQRFKKPKSGKLRFVDLPEFLVNDLNAYIRQLRLKKLKQGRGAEVDYLFEDPKTDDRWPLSQRKTQRLVERVCKGAKLARRNPHDLRHTYATIMLMAHQSPAYVMKQLGHSSIRTTVDIYGHWIPGEGRHGLDEALLGGQPVPNCGEKPHIFPYNRKGSQ